MAIIPASPGVYKITCTANQKVYIGSSTNLRRRLQRHARMLRLHVHFSTHLQAAWNVYGESAFTFDVVEHIEDQSILVGREQYWLDYYRANDSAHGFNKAKRAEFPMMGLSHTEETRRKISEAGRNRKHSKETREKQSVAAQGRKHTLAARQKMAQAKRGTKMSAEQRALRSKHYIVTTPDGHEFEIVGLRPFCEAHGLNCANMQSVAAGRKLSCKGWRVRYKP